MNSKKVQTLSSFPQYVSKVQRIITEQKQQWLTPVATETRRKRGRSSRPLQFSTTEASRSPKLPQRQRPFPRTLSPLHKLRRKPSPNVVADAPRSGRRHNDQLQNLSELGVSGISHLVVPVPGLYGHGHSSCSSSSSNSPVPTSLITLQCKSKESLSSGSSDLSPPAFKRATPISLNAVEMDQPAAVVVELQRSHSRSSLSVQRASSKSPYMAPLGVVRKKSRRAKKAAQQLEPTDRSRDQGGIPLPISSRETLVTPITLVPRDALPVSQCTVKIWNPPENVEETATGARDQQVGGNFSMTVPTLLLEPDGALCIPTITIRSATPIKAPNEDENLLALCEKLAFRADMEDELDKLREEIKALSDASNTPQAPITH